MKSVKVSVVLQNIGDYPFLYLRDFSNPSVKQAYKPICVIPDGEDKGKLLLARWRNCAQKLLDPQSILYFE